MKQTTKPGIPRGHQVYKVEYDLTVKYELTTPKIIPGGIIPIGSYVDSRYPSMVYYVLAKTDADAASKTLNMVYKGPYLFDWVIANPSTLDIKRSGWIPSWRKNKNPIKNVTFNIDRISKAEPGMLPDVPKQTRQRK